MKKMLLTLLGLVAACCLSAQDEYNFYPLFEPTDSSEQYIFADTAYVRSEATTRSTAADTLYQGAPVLLLGRLQTKLTIRGIEAPWVKIRYHKNGQLKEGFMWSGLLSFPPLRRGNVKFVYGVDRIVKNMTAGANGQFTDIKYLVRLKVIQDTALLASSQFAMTYSEAAAFVAVKMLPPKGLSNVLYIPSIVFSGEACGIPTLTYMHTWNGKKLYALPMLTDIGDAEVFYHTETFIFPADKTGKANCLMLKTEEGESTEKLDKKGELIYKTTNSKKAYTWDGEKLVDYK
jgi:uncharacterized protein YxeA